MVTSHTKMTGPSLSGYGTRLCESDPSRMTRACAAGRRPRAEPQRARARPRVLLHADRAAPAPALDRARGHPDPHVDDRRGRLGVWHHAVGGVRVRSVSRQLFLSRPPCCPSTLPFSCLSRPSLLSLCCPSTLPPCLSRPSLLSLCWSEAVSNAGWLAGCAGALPYGEATSDEAVVAHVTRVAPESLLSIPPHCPRPMSVPVPCRG